MLASMLPVHKDRKDPRMCLNDTAAPMPQCCRSIRTGKTGDYRLQALIGLTGLNAAGP